MFVGCRYKYILETYGNICVRQVQCMTSEIVCHLYLQIFTILQNETYRLGESTLLYVIWRSVGPG